MNINRYNKNLSKYPSGLHIEPFFKSRDGLNYLKTYYSDNSPVIKEIKKIIEG